MWDSRPAPAASGPRLCVGGGKSSPERPWGGSKSLPTASAQHRLEPSGEGAKRRRVNPNFEVVCRGSPRRSKAQLLVPPALGALPPSAGGTRSRLPRRFAGSGRSTRVRRPATPATAPGHPPPLGGPNEGTAVGRPPYSAGCKGPRACAGAMRVGSQVGDPHSPPHAGGWRCALTAENPLSVQRVQVWSVDRWPLARSLAKAFGGKPRSVPAPRGVTVRGHPPPWEPISQCAPRPKGPLQAAFSAVDGSLGSSAEES